MKKGILVCDVGKDYEFDCTLNGKKIEIHQIQMKNGHFASFFLNPTYRHEYVRTKEERSKAKARTAMEKRHGFKAEAKKEITLHHE